jgi:hypothetical protein
MEREWLTSQGEARGGVGASTGASATPLATAPPPDDGRPDDGPAANPIDPAIDRISGHQPRAAGPLASTTPEHDWSVARDVVFPILRPPGTTGLQVAGIDVAQMREESARTRNQPLVDEGPAGIAVVYVIHGEAYDVIVNGEHLLTWGIEPSEIQDTAMANLAAWSAGAPWTDEVSGERRLLSSDSGDGWDAARILLPDVRDHVADELASAGRILVGLPERHLLVAGPLREGDDEFARLFADFVLETSGEADEPIDRRVFELVEGRIVDYRP